MDKGGRKEREGGDEEREARGGSAHRLCSHSCDHRSNF